MTQQQLRTKQQQSAAPTITAGATMATARAATRSLRRKEHDQLSERARRSAEEDNSPEAKLFAALFYTNIVRKEFANHVLREHALPPVQADKWLCRHTVKQNLRAVKQEMAKWDCQIAYSLLSDENLERFDFLCEHMNRQLFKLYEPFYFSTMQLLTKNHCRNAALVAGLETASALAEYAERRLTEEINQCIMKSPIVGRLAIMRDPRLVHCLDTLRREVGNRMMPRGCTDLDLNADPMIDQAATNLFRRLNDANGINSMIDDTFTQGVATEWGLSEG